MNDTVKNYFKNMQNFEQDVVEQIFAILELPDAQFDAIYPKFINKVKEAFQSNIVRKQIIEQLSTIEYVNLKEEIEEVNKEIKEINDDDSLSNNKKEMMCTLLNLSKDLLVEVIKNPREIVDVRIVKLREDAIIPTYAHDTDAGADVSAIEETIIEPHTNTIVKTGLKVAIPVGYEIQIRPRSGLSLKTNLRIPNAPGTIDSDYRGEVGIIVSNIGDEPIIIKKGDRIAQMLIAPTPMIRWNEVTELDDTNRGEKGYGSTDKS